MNEGILETEEIDNTLKNILDYKYLKGRIQDYSKAIDVLMEPGRMDTLSERMAEVLQGIWMNRKEDVENVFVHELIHYLKIDHDLVNSTNTLHTFFNISNTILINEGYTEMLTILYVSLCNSIFLHLDYKDILYHEYIYSLFITDK